MIKFGSFLPQGWKREYVYWNRPGKEPEAIRNVALECERLGYNSVWVFDHFITFPEVTTEPCFESWTTLTYVASITKKLGLGTMVMCNSYRHPSVLAKMSATLDYLSNGRLTLGIGAGWSDLEHSSYGISFFKPSVRIGQLGEAVQIIKKMWTEDKASFKGKYYTIKEAINGPKPFQKPHPPILIGGKGRKLTLRVTAQFANLCNFGGLATPDEYKEALGALNAHCAKVGRNPNEIEKTHTVGYVLIGENEKEVEEKIKKFKPKSIATEEFVRRNLVGTPEQIIRKAQKYVDLGVTYFMVYFPDVLEIEPLRMFAEHIFPAFK